jgi:integrase
MASLQVRHTRTCALRKPWTTAAALEGCDCRPAWYVVSRVDGKLVRDPAGHDRAEAEKALRRIEVHTDENRYQPPQHETFSEHADEWLAGVRRRSTTKQNYAVTLGYAKAVFGRKRVEKLTVSDVTRFLAHVERENLSRKPPRTVSEATLAKHLRQLSACLAAARTKGLLENPVKALDKSRKPRAVRGAPAYFTDDELRRLWTALEKRPIHLVAFKLLATTGMRFGELAGLKWSDVRLLEGELDVRRQFTAGEEVDRPKDSEPRVVHLVPAARTLLDEWWIATGDEGLVFENEDGGHLDDSRARKVLYAALTRGGIARVGESGGKRNIHSLRHVFARSCLEAGAPLDWLKDELGHSSITLTVDTYGKWAQAASREQAERLEGAFAV